MSDKQRRKCAPRLPPLRHLQASSVIHGIDKVVLLQDDFLLIPGRSRTNFLQQLPISCDHRRYFSLNRNFKRLSTSYRNVRQALDRRDALERQRAVLREALSLQQLQTRLMRLQARQGSPGDNFSPIKLCSSVVSELRGILERIEDRIQDLEGTLFEEIAITVFPIVTEVLFLLRKFLDTNSVWWKESDTSDAVSCAMEYNKLLDDVQYKNEKGLKDISLMLVTGREPCLVAVNVADVVCGLLRHQASHIAVEVIRCLQDGNKLGDLGRLEKRVDDLVDNVVKSMGGEKQSVIVNLCQSLAWDLLVVPGCASGVANGSDSLSCDGCRQCVKISMCSLCIVRVLCDVLCIDQMLIEELKSLWLSPVCLFAQHVATEADWDKRFTHILGAAAIDKCLPSRIQSETVKISTTTTQLLVACLKEQQSDLEVTMNYLSRQTRRIHDCLPTVKHLLTMSALERRLLGLFETLHFGYHWLSSKIRHSLSAWNISKMVLLIYCDFPAFDSIVEELKTVVATGTASGCDGLSCMNMLVSSMLDEITKLKNDCQSQFERDCYRMSLDFWHQAFPMKKIWRCKAKGIVTEQSNYVDSAILQLLYPFTSGVSDVPADAQLQVLATSTTAAIETLKEHVLDKKIIFSVDGAKQLQIDVCYLRDWLTPDNCSDIPDTVCMNLQHLNCFTEILHGISLLLQQHHGRKQSRFDSAYPESCSSPTYSGQGTSESRSTDRESCSTSRKDSEVSQGSTFSSDEGELTDSERWVRLRLHGSGQRKWKAKLNCFQ